ncbi:unnamed protein product [Ceutorhynchus assimilis]|uniref:Uncharacterized protein n=1 Tax=Ceutorhynchus assimilis TaxID=467358 RepID=A0A9N9QLN6_9CUCU|nr:unnamed protein product [Ceutorhynchus assimilis]
MALELILLGALIFIFIVSFCGLLQKIRQTYERERLLAERLRRRPPRRVSNIEVFTVFPAVAAPPPYTQNYIDEPPKYEEIIKADDDIMRITNPPPYTITIN